VTARNVVGFILRWCYTKADLAVAVETRKSALRIVGGRWKVE
jgi:hypothetical protein